MTIQVTDTIFWNRKDYSLVAYSDAEPFDPVLHGFRPVMASTGCWRGYVCEYSVDDGELILDALYISHENDNLPELNGRAAIPSDNPFIGQWLFRDVQLRLSYTGGLLAAKTMLKNHCSLRYFPPLLSYRHVYELIFEEGKLKSSSDVSRSLKDIQALADSKEGTLQTVIDRQLGEAFEKDYGI